MHRTRRRALRSVLATLAATIARTATGTPGPDETAYAPVRRGTPIAFPRDHGAHPDFRIEWWYVTGWLRRLDGPDRGEPAGVQITFFRSRTGHDRANPSRFAPTQLLFAHAALALPENDRLRVVHRAARGGLGLAHASTEDTDVAIGAWTLERATNDTYRSRIEDENFSLDLSFRTRATPLLQGDAGFSRKGPRPEQASYYYSRPQLEVEGSISVGARATPVEGVAWLDHEWSSEILDVSAVGWDWVGLNFDDGSALMAFRIRRADGTALWADAKWRRGAGDSRAFGPHDPTLRFDVLRRWTSPRTGAAYPVSMQLSIEDRVLRLEPLIDDQELDTRGTTGVVYWEGAVRVFEGSKHVGAGYLELTGYASPVRM